MADDPRIEAAARAEYEHQRDAEEREWGRGTWERIDEAIRERYRQPARRAVAAADAVGPLRGLGDLLADEGRAVEIGAKARYLASTVSAEPDWDRQTARAKDSYREQVRDPVRAVLAALREVAGL